MLCAGSLRDFVAQRPAGDVMIAEERAALEEPTAAAKKEAVAAARVAAAEAAKAAAEDAARRRYGPMIVHVKKSKPFSHNVCLSALSGVAGQRGSHWQSIGC